MRCVFRFQDYWGRQFQTFLVTNRLVKLHANDMCLETWWISGCEPTSVVLCFCLEVSNVTYWSTHDRSTSLTPPFLLMCFIPSQTSERPSVCVLGYRFCIFPQFFSWILELFRHCGIFAFFSIVFRRTTL